MKKIKLELVYNSQNNQELGKNYDMICGRRITIENWKKNLLI